MKTDAQLRHDVMAELRWDPAVHAAQIGVEVKDGVVTLAERDNQSAWGCPGVQKLIDKMTLAS